jgi:hypothetical protein
MMNSMAIAIAVCGLLIACGILRLVKPPDSDPNIGIAGKDFEEAQASHEKAMGNTALTPELWDQLPRRRASDLGAWNGRE